MQNFSYLIPGVLAGSAQPYQLQDLQRFVREGIKVLVTVMEEPLDTAMVEATGLEYHYWPVPPYGTPTFTQLQDFIELVNKNRAQNRPVAVHCYMGCGRTGTFLAAYLISEGLNARKAIQEVRTKRPCSIETYDQEQALNEFERFYQKPT